MSDTLSSWSDIVKLHDQLQRTVVRPVFRGQGNAEPLSPSFERLATRYNIPAADWARRERWLLREFQRHYHRFAPHVPAPDDTVRWYSIMQHHGAPTRALDFTYSFWIALFFALEDVLANEKATPTLWWLSLDEIWKCFERAKPDYVKQLRPSYGKDPVLINQLLQEGCDLALTFTPEGLDERLAIQQGLHLLPLTLGRPLHTLLTESLSDQGIGHVRISFDPVQLLKALEELQAMNVDRRVLFPGLDGLAQGLQHRLGMRHLFPPDGYGPDA